MSDRIYCICIEKQWQTVKSRYLCGDKKCVSYRMIMTTRSITSQGLSYRIYIYICLLTKCKYNNAILCVRDCWLWISVDFVQPDFEAAYNPYKYRLSAGEIRLKCIYTQFYICIKKKLITRKLYDANHWGCIVFLFSSCFPFLSAI